MSWRRTVLFSMIGLLGTLPLASCDRTTLQRTFSADPQAGQWNGTTATAKLPTDFPLEIQYPKATLKSASSSEPLGQQTQWLTSDSRDQILRFYRAQFQLPQWQDLKEASGDGVTIVSAQRQTLAVSVSVPLQLATEQPSATGGTQFTVAYHKGQLATSQATPTSSGSADAFTDLSQVPPSLQPYVKDVATLETLTVRGPSDAATLPNQSISRAQFARWLVELNNRIYTNRPARQIRLAADSKPAFVDVPATHPDFALIQGLAESGYVPSPLSGDSAQTRFRPDAPLTRETLLLWKVPIDRQQVLPTVSAERVKQLWGFKDTNRIMPPALSAVAADHQNGDLSNIRRVLGSTLLFQPQKPVTYAEAAAALWFIGTEGDSLSVQDLLRAEQQEKAAPSATPQPKSSQ